MKQQGLALKNVAHMAGVSISVVQGWLTGSSPRDLWAVYRLAKELSVNFQDLLFGTPETRGQLSAPHTWNHEAVDKNLEVDAEIILDPTGKVVCFNNELPSFFHIPVETPSQRDELPTLISNSFKSPDLLFQLISDFTQGRHNGGITLTSQETSDGRLLDIRIEEMQQASGTSGCTALRFRDVTRKHLKTKWTELYQTIVLLLSDHKAPDATPAVLEAICKTKGFLCGEFWSIDQTGRVLSLQSQCYTDTKASSFVEAGKNLDLPQGVCLPGIAWEAQSVQIISSFENTSFLRANLAKNCGIVGAIAIPIMAETTTLGVLCFYFGQGWTPRPGITEHLETVGIQLAKYVVRLAEYRQKKEALAIRAAVLDEFSDGVLVVDRNHSVLECNRSAEKLLGRRLDNILGRHISSCLPEQLYSFIIRTSKNGHSEKANLVHNGTPLEVRISHLAGSDFRALAIFFRAIRSAQVISILPQNVPSSVIPPEDYRLLFEFVPTPLLVLSTDFKMLAANHARSEATATHPDQVIGKQLFDVFTDNPNDPSRTGVVNLHSSLKRVMKTKKSDKMPTQKYSIKRVTSQGETFEVRYWDPINTPILDKAGEVKYIIHQAIDVTEWINHSGDTHSEESSYTETRDLHHLAESTTEDPVNIARPKKLRRTG